MTVCATCSRELQPEWKFCIYCGTPTGVPLTAAIEIVRAAAETEDVRAAMQAAGGLRTGAITIIPGPNPLPPVDAAAAPAAAPAPAPTPEPVVAAPETPAPPPAPVDDFVFPEDDDFDYESETVPELDATPGAEPRATPEHEATSDPEPSDPETDAERAQEAAEYASTDTGEVLRAEDIPHDEPSAPVPVVQATPAAKVNVLAVLALVLGCLVSPLAAVFGHLALNQISRSGERGTAIAWVAIVLGYLSLAALLVLGISYFVLNA